MRRSKFLIMVIISVIIHSIHVGSQDLEQDLVKVVNKKSFVYEDNSFFDLLGAWQEIKIYNISLLEMLPDITEVYSVGEVLDMEQEKYSTGYIFLTNISMNEAISITINTQVDIVITDGQVEYIYSISAAEDIGLEEKDLQDFARKYLDNLDAIDARFNTFNTGSKRLYKLYH